MRPAPLVAILGPTASGKSDLAIGLAQRFGGEVINFDSIQLYRELNIGSAKVPDDERLGITHHLIGLLPADAVFSAGDYVRLAKPLLAEVTRRGKLPVLAGGTGFYLRALVDGLSEGPKRDEKVRERLASWEGARLYRLLLRLDATAGARIHPNDKQKLLRALEICLISRRSMSSVHRASTRLPLDGYRTVKLLLQPPKEQLQDRIEQRTKRMFESGLVEEVRAILKSGYSSNAKALESIGYREALRHIKGELTLEEAITLTAVSTRQYAKRQRTWMRRETGITVPLEGFGFQADMFAEAAKAVRMHLEI